MSTRHLANNFIFVNNRKGKVCSYHISTFAVYFIGSMGKIIDLTGQKFGRLTVIEKAFGYKNGAIMWRCKCDCGAETIIIGSHLRSGNTKSCGCIRIEKPNNTKHGMKHTRIYNEWCGIKRRCYNQNNPCYKNYGGRGITVCDEWKNDFQAFYNWAMSNGYRDELTIDRIDVNGNYEPSNCRWATRKEQGNNTTKSHRLTYNGETHTIAEWAEITGIHKNTIYYRINNGGWSVEKALSTPIL